MCKKLPSVKSYLCMCLGIGALFALDADIHLQGIVCMALAQMCGSNVTVLAFCCAATAVFVNCLCIVPAG